MPSSDVCLPCLFRMSKIMLWTTVHRLLRNARILYRDARGAFTLSCSAPRVDSFLFVILGASGPVIYLRSLSPGRSERLLSRRRSREAEIFERDGEIERDGKGKYETRLGLFSVLRFYPSFFPRSSVSVICRLLFDSTPLALA